MYDNHHDAQMRLADCIITFDGRPVYIHHIRDEEDLPVVFSYLDTREEGVVPIDDIRFNREPVHTGYVNYRGQVDYVQRAPCRRWKVGLNFENVQASNPHVINTPEMAKTILNEYPTFTETLDAVRTGRYQACAWTRRFALKREDDVGLVWLYYRNEKAGWVQDDTPVLGENSQYLAEELQEALG
jgi:hypothetical protein